MRNEEKRTRQEPQDSTIPTPRFERNFATWNHQNRTGGTYSQNCMMENPRNQISELHFGEFPDSADLQCWKVNVKTEVCADSMLWNKTVQIATSVDDLMTSQSIEGRDFPDFEILDAKIAFALMKIISNQHFRRRVRCRRAACSKTRQISTRKAD